MKRLQGIGETYASLLHIFFKVVFNACTRNLKCCIKSNEFYSLVFADGLKMLKTQKSSQIEKIVKHLRRQCSPFKAIIETYTYNAGIVTMYSEHEMDANMTLHNKLHNF